MLFSVRLKCYTRETESLHCNPGRTDLVNLVIVIFGGTDMHLGETDSVRVRA